MKKMFLFVFVYSITLTSCDDELCYNCTQASSGNTSNFCLPRDDAKQKKSSLESAGYNCRKQ